MVADATDNELLTRLESKRFDAISCGMAIMDMPEIEPLANSVARLLKPGGRFVFAVMHPAFNSPNGLSRSVERVEMEDGRIVDTLAIKFLTTSIQRRTRAQRSSVSQFSSSTFTDR